jgi:translin
MDKLDAIGESIHAYLDEKNRSRDQALQNSRSLIRHCSQAIRAVHRNEREKAMAHIQKGSEFVAQLKTLLDRHPDIYYSGYSRDAQKEYAEANIVFGLVMDNELPGPEELDIAIAAYVGGLGEAAGELRRRVLDILRHDKMQEGERLLEAMEDIYGFLVTVDFPDAITGNLRRITDMVRGVTERTRGDLTTSIQQRELKEALRAVEEKLDRVT